MFIIQIKQEQYSPQGTQSVIIGESYPPPSLSVIRTIYNAPSPPPPAPSSINQQVLRKLCAKFDTFVTSVTIWPIFCTKRPDY